MRVASQQNTHKMAPMVRQDTAQVLDDLLGFEEDYAGQILDEISNLATMENLPFDNTKLVEDYGMDLVQTPAVEVQPAVPELSLDALIHDDFHSSDAQPASPEFVAIPSFNMEYLTPEPSHTQVQPFSPTSQDLLDVGALSTSTELTVMQPVIPEASHTQGEPLSHLPQELFDGGAQPTTTELLMMQPSGSNVYIKMQPASPQQLDLLQECSSLGPDSFLVSSSGGMNQQPYSPVSQQLDVSQDFLSLDNLVPSPADSFVPSPSPVVKLELSMSQPQQQHPADAPKKRGRKRKYPEGTAPRNRRPRKPKAYEMLPCKDEEAEKKRKNAINAKRHRDMQKQEKEKLSVALNAATAERDRLVDTVKQYKQREQQLLQLLNSHGIKIVGLENL